jgi:hypothetical protein
MRRLKACGTGLLDAGLREEREVLSGRKRRTARRTEPVSRERARLSVGKTDCMEVVDATGSGYSFLVRNRVLADRAGFLRGGLPELEHGVLREPGDLSLLDGVVLRASEKELQDLCVGRPGTTARGCGHGRAREGRAAGALGGSHGRGGDVPRRHVGEQHGLNVTDIACQRGWRADGDCPARRPFSGECGLDGRRGRGQLLDRQGVDLGSRGGQAHGWWNPRRGNGEGRGRSGQGALQRERQGTGF